MALRFLFLLLLASTGAANEAVKNCDPVALSPTQVCPLQPGTTVPDVSFRTFDGEKKNLPELVKGKNTVLVFYRGGWCPYCDRQLHQLQDLEPKLKTLGYQVIAISPDKPEKVRGSIKSQYLTFLLLSDSKMEGSKAFGIAYKLDEPSLKGLEAMAINLENSSGEKHSMLPVPTTFLVNEQGTIQFTYSDPDYKNRISSEMLLSKIQKLQKKKLASEGTAGPQKMPTSSGRSAQPSL
ncbi:redoxin domain-containing protein [bacterium]|jgi:peroxiredoxin|nr:redoxin domain-containing protein [bacterium]